jgi:hypothetical protein
VAAEMSGYNGHSASKDGGFSTVDNFVRFSTPMDKSYELICTSVYYYYYYLINFRPKLQYSLVLWRSIMEKYAQNSGI